VKGDGGELSVAPDTYNMVIYNFSTKWTQVRGEGDITEQFAKTDHHIVIDDSIDVPEPEGGGIAPSIESWDKVFHDITIG